jgi:hypothetical protein
MAHETAVIAGEAQDALDFLDVGRGAERLKLGDLLIVGPEPVARCTLDALDASVRALSQASPGFKRRVVDACVAAVTAARRTTVVEAELLRAICASIGVPMPPIEAVVSA